MKNLEGNVQFKSSPNIDSYFASLQGQMNGKIKLCNKIREENQGVIKTMKILFRQMKNLTFLFKELQDFETKVTMKRKILGEFNWKQILVCEQLHADYQKWAQEVKGSLQKCKKM